MSHDDDPREDGGVLICGEPDCNTCWLFAPRSPELFARIRDVAQAATRPRFRLETYR